MKQTITCPNGCDAAELEREDSGGFVAPGIFQAGAGWRNRQGGLYDPPDAIYHCQSCDWTARWVLGEGLQVQVAGIGRE